MGKQTLHFELSTYLGINYTRCCGVVLMHYNNRVYGRFNAIYTML